MANEKGIPSEPSLKYIQQPNFGRPNNSHHQPIQDISKPHIDSFNYMIRGGLTKAVQDLKPEEFELPNKDRIKLEIRDALIGRPTLSKGVIQCRTLDIYPSECRNRRVTYKGKLQVTLSLYKNGVHISSTERVIGEVPIMVKSDLCNLKDLSPKQLIEKGEDAGEFGGYFITNGLEHVLRMLVLPRKNYPLAIKRPSWKSRGKLYSEYGLSIRCVKSDQSAANMVLHYLTTGTANLMFSFKKELFFVPIMMVLKALCDVSDQYICSEMLKGCEKNSFFKGCINNMLLQLHNENLTSHKKIKKFIGEHFRIKVGLPLWYTDEQITDFLLKECIAVHLDSNVDKFNLLVFMTRKLFAFAKGECAAENPDCPMNFEVLTSGHLYLMVLKEKLGTWLNSFRQHFERVAKNTGRNFSVTQQVVNQCFGRSYDVGHAMEYLISTGNLTSSTGLGLMQFSGLSIIAEKLNFHRYISHFRSFHRGAFFAEMRTTTPRKLLPEAWGYLCPVHTPDGSPCGLLNHISINCEITHTQPPVAPLPKLLINLGMSPYDLPCPFPIFETYPVLLDGRILGWIAHSEAQEFVAKLRMLKTKELEKVPSTLEIAFVPATGKASQYPGLYLFSTPARLMRPVLNLATNTVEMIGIFEQVYLDICVSPEEAKEGLTTHQELSKTGMLSILANTVPYSNYNQSPRNMYQCQMLKQTMGTPCHCFSYRSDNKLYRIQNPQSPIVRPTVYDHYYMDDYPCGTNAIVAVISYTGYDMEDAMVLNKASVERGFKHASIYKSEEINLRKIAGELGSQVTFVFGRKPADTFLDNKIDMDGLPFIGQKICLGHPICSYIELASGITKVEKYKYDEECYIHEVKLLGNDSGTDILQRILITFWIPRNPIIGDKFASRHGQKGVCSIQAPIENMPFTESGMTPDIIFNPHGYPSRMTIGMIIESMAGKSGALHGLVHDATPFKFPESSPPSDYFGKLLEAAGYNYYGAERMYSGIDGRELKADIYFGVVFYQRLRHMVSDKYQVRSTGPRDNITHQPVKGRKRKGGIRFGEMERDSLLAHGTAFLLQDRLFNCSDKSLAYVCRHCGSILSPMFEKTSSKFSNNNLDSRWFCKTCQSNEPLDVIEIPYVFRYLVSELVSANIKVKLNAK